VRSSPNDPQCALSGRAWDQARLAADRAPASVGPELDPRDWVVFRAAVVVAPGSDHHLEAWAWTLVRPALSL